jgi:murein DD-endopeptidase MepM/ murein hydrolase activator NlpD
MGNVKTLTSSVTSLKKELSGVYDVLKKIKGLGPSAFGDVNAVLSKSGQFGNGQGTPVFAKTPVNGAPKFSSQTPMASAKPGSNAQQSQYEKTAMAIQTQYLDMGIRQAKFGMAAGVVAATGAVVSGVSGMLPATGQVAQRAGIFYGASAMFGGTNRIANQKATFSAMRGGITSDMGDAEAFSALTSFSFMPGSKNMAQGLGDVSAAAKALGMDNANAAAAVGAMSTGSMGAQLYQYGIRQYDDKGNLRKSGDISKDILQRVFYPGQDVSKIGAEQFAKDSMGMNLDYQLSTMGITGDFLTKTKAEMGLAVTGKNPNLESVDTSGSPLKSFLDIQTSETKLVQKHEKDILIGAQKAAAALKTLNEKLELTPPLIVQLNSALTTFLATKSGGGVKDLVTGVVGGVASTIMASKALTALKNLKAGISPATTEVTKPATKEAAKKAALQTAARTAATTTATTVAGTSAATAAGVTAAIALPGAALIGMQSAYYKQGQENLTEMERIAAAQANGWKNPDGTPYAAGPKETFMSAAPEKSWWQKTKNFFSTHFKGMDSSSTGVQGGPTSGFSSNVSGNAPSVNAFTFSSGAKPMAGGAVASSMSATSISKVVGAGFGAKDSSLTMAGALNYHTGQDTPMEVGTPVHARFAGKVVERNLSRDLGIAVEVDHGDGYSSIYGHLNLKSVRAGQDVKVGDLIGKSGATGRVRGPHLHFELRKGKVPTDPKGYAAGNPGGGADSGATGGASKVILGTGSEKEWAAGLLGKLGAPVSDSSVNALTTWMRHEGGHWKNSAHYNPLNTTLNVSNNESMNSVGVKRYKSWDEGYAATVGTLTGKSADARGYTAIVNALKSGASTETILSAVSNSAWVTGKTGQNSYKGFKGGGTPGSPGIPTTNAMDGVVAPSSVSVSSPSGGNNVVNFNVYLHDVSDAQAMIWAKKVESYISGKKEISAIGGK